MEEPSTISSSVLVGLRVSPDADFKICQRRLGLFRFSIREILKYSCLAQLIDWLILFRRALTCLQSWSD